MHKHKYQITAVPQNKINKHKKQRQTRLLQWETILKQLMRRGSSKFSMPKDSSCLRVLLFCISHFWKAFRRAGRWTEYGQSGRSLSGCSWLRWGTGSWRCPPYRAESSRWFSLLWIIKRHHRKLVFLYPPNNFWLSKYFKCPHKGLNIPYYIHCQISGGGSHN